ncbi:hypothetical protein DFH08DRAFT_964998 [Mycena albidolilacea]|uniref:Uncharacterized protein n=1 Tax=Mycena albidolilacea TaxID=1033008 RepID=A0AAD6ZRF6_9AGAR|nr:hypothetical protein DFH08DRAFT_964998 [Mycena albidolilacea]
MIDCWTVLVSSRWVTLRMTGLSIIWNTTVWNETRSFKVVACNADSCPLQSLKKVDGPTDHPMPIYEAATAQTPSLFHWRGYWMSVGKGTAGLSHYDTDAASGGERPGAALVLSVWSRRLDILDEFVSAAHEFYVNSSALPRKQVDMKREPHTSKNQQSDLAHDWMLEYLVCLTYNKLIQMRLYVSYEKEMAAASHSSNIVAILWQRGKENDKFKSVEAVKDYVLQKVAEIEAQLHSCVKQALDESGGQSEDSRRWLRTMLYLVSGNAWWSQIVSAYPIQRDLAHLKRLRATYFPGTYPGAGFFIWKV